MWYPLLQLTAQPGYVPILPFAGADAEHAKLYVNVFEAVFPAISRERVRRVALPLSAMVPLYTFESVDTDAPVE